MLHARSIAVLAVSAWLLLAACGGSGGQGSSSDGASSSGGTGTSSTQGATGQSNGSGSTNTSSAPGVAGSAGGWVTVASEDFEHLDPGSPAWMPDPVPDDGPFADGGLYFQRKGVTPPAAFRISHPFGAASWLTAESYTRDAAKPFSHLLSVVPDPANAANKVLRIASPAHTDATVIRSTEPLPSRYRISLRVGFPSFGDGLPGLNGYATGSETAEPWWPDSAVTQNGFYELAILDAMPRPHNNTWIHHHRKVVMDSDNNYPPWMEIWNGSRFVTSGEHPVMMFAVDGRAPDNAQSGKAFLAWSGDAWQKDLIRAVDSYLPGQWYTVSVERFDMRFTLTIAGTFRYGGDRTYTTSIDAAANCVWHFNRSPSEDASGCVDPTPYDTLGPEFPQWPAGATWPDYFMFGDPHENYYMGEVYYDDVRLETWQE